MWFGVPFGWGVVAVAVVARLVVVVVGCCCAGAGVCVWCVGVLAGVVVVVVN